jgi:BirA family biotin operon repressor/biotin-[acetyl-CoA-carboxylase] ligase
MDRIKYAILGVGINANNDVEDLPEELREVATSIKIQTGQKTNRSELAASILEELMLNTVKLKNVNLILLQMNGRNFAKLLASRLQSMSATGQFMGG